MFSWSLSCPNPSAYGMPVLGAMQNLWLVVVFKPPPPVGAGGGYMFSGRPSVPLSVRPCVRPSAPSVRPSVRDSHGSFMFP